MKSQKKVITLFVAAALVLSLGTVGAFAAVNASRVNPDDIKVVYDDDGNVKLKMYVTPLDENGEPIQLTDEEQQEMYDLMGLYLDEDGFVKVIGFDYGETDGQEVNISVVPEGCTPLSNRDNRIQPGS